MGPVNSVNNETLPGLLSTVRDSCQLLSTDDTAGTPVNCVNNETLPGLLSTVRESCQLLSTDDTAGTPDFSAGKQDSLVTTCTGTTVANDANYSAVDVNAAGAQTTCEATNDTAGNPVKYIFSVGLARRDSDATFHESTRWPCYKQQSTGWSSISTSPPGGHAVNVWRS